MASLPYHQVRSALLSTRFSIRSSSVIQGADGRILIVFSINGACLSSREDRVELYWSISTSRSDGSHTTGQKHKSERKESRLKSLKERKQTTLEGNGGWRTRREHSRDRWSLNGGPALIEKSRLSDGRESIKSSVCLRDWECHDEHEWGRKTCWSRPKESIISIKSRARESDVISSTW